MLRNHERYGGAVLIGLMMLVLLLLCQLGAFLAVGASRAKANIGGAESAMDKVARDLELKQRVQQMANEGREFVFNSQEEVNAVFLCTACGRVMHNLAPRVIGRISTAGRERGETEEVLTDMIESVCDQAAIRKDAPVREGCERFIEENVDPLLELLLPRCDPHSEQFEEDILDVARFCRSETTACPPGARSMEDLLAGQMEQEDAKEKKKETVLKTEKKTKKKTMKKGKPKANQEQKPKVSIPGRKRDEASAEAGRRQRKETMTKMRRKRKKKNPRRGPPETDL